MSQGLKRAHHTVPRTLLKGFCDGAGLLRVRRRDGKEFLSSITSASVHRDFYSFTDLDGHLVDDVEDWLDTGVEDPASPVLARAREGLPPEQADVVPLARFAAVGLLRTATVRSYFRQIGTTVGPLVLAAMSAKKAGLDLAALPDPDRDAWLANAAEAWAGMSPAVDTVQSQLRTTLRKCDELATALAEWDWSLLSAAVPALITGDAPVATFTADDGGWHGILPPGSSIFIPVTSRRVLVGDQHRLGNGQLTPALARLINTSLASEVFSAVYLDPSMDWPEYLHLSPTPPELPVPTVTWSAAAEASAPTFPAVYPPTSDVGIQQLLATLDAEDTVE